MKNYFYTTIIILFFIWDIPALSGQQTECLPSDTLPSQGEVLLNYGSTLNATTFSFTGDVLIGQPAVGISTSTTGIMQTGYWSRLLLPPGEPALVASQGNFPNRVQLNWEVDPFWPDVTEGFIIRRDGVFLAELSSDKREFIDFNVQAGEYYEYSVIGKNQFGIGVPGTEVGFVNPNGVVSGRVTTNTGNPVAGAVVRLEPTIGKSLQFNGMSDYLCVSHNPEISAEMWTVSAWVKIGDNYDRSGIIDLGSDLNKNFWLLTTGSGDGKGVIAGLGDGTNAYELSHEFEEDPNGWHHVAAVYAAGNLLLYVNGHFIASRNGVDMGQAARFSIGSRRDQTGFFEGHIDDVRLFNRPLTSTEIYLNKDITLSSTFSGLVAYWKFDEGIGAKVFDLSNNKMHADIHGAVFSSNTPGIVNAGTTDVGGYYSIPGINYSQVQTFNAIPSKSFYSSYALEFNPAYEAYANLTKIALSEQATLEIIFKPFDLLNRQSLLSRGSDDFELFIEAGQLHLTVNGETQALGMIDNDYRHTALTLNNASGQVQYFLDGDLENTLTYSNLNTSWPDSLNWQLAARGGQSPEDFYTGLIDEVAFFDTTLAQSMIQLHASTLPGGGIDPGNGFLTTYFSLNEGRGQEVYDFGPAMTGTGEVFNSTFSIITYRQDETPHEFRPAQRILNINFSSTTANGIDFIDESTIPISGVIRFENTFCYQPEVEILVNGERAFPPIFTDENGRFVGDFEPGATVTLTPKFEDHSFLPAFFQVRQINRPVSGVLFQNTTKRTITGQMAGNEKCRLSVINSTDIVRVKVKALNECFSRELQLENSDGKFTFTDLPPIPFSVAVTQHSNNVIYDFFQVLGGQELDMRMVEKDTVDFIYIAPPHVSIEPFPENGCPGDGLKMIQQSTPQNNYREYDLDIRVFELYDGGQCFLDSFILTIENDIGDQSPIEVVVEDSTVYNFKFWAGIPNIIEPYTKFLQVTAEVGGAQATAIEEVVVLGERSRESSFTTATPALPLIILRDPPGDGSFSTLSEGSTHCQQWSDAGLVSVTQNVGVHVDLGAKVITYAGTPFGGIIQENEQINQIDITGSFGASTTITNAGEFCITNDRTYMTSSDSDILYNNADMYVGAGVNFEFSATDVLSFDPDSLVCDFNLGQNVRVNPKSFNTKYLYSEWQIKTDVIPDLEFIGDTASADAWRAILAYNEELKRQAVFRENLSFDALTNYTETFTTTKTSSLDFSTSFTWEAGMNTVLGFNVFGVGTKVSLGFKMGGGYTTTSGSSDVEARTVSFTLADSDVNDNFTVDILDDPVFGTPVFRLVSGESMCPWEPGTQNREEVSLGIDKLTVVNVPPNSPAVFNLTLGNIGQTGKDNLVYVVGVKPGSNPDGASISIDGQGPGPIAYQIPPFGSINVQMTIDRGPEKYSYKDIGIFMASQCMLEHSLSVGYNLAGAYDEPDVPFQGPYATEDLRKFYEEVKVNVEFIEPCSPIDIGWPLQGWVMTPNGGDNLSITLDQYINDDPELELVRVQYRRTGGDGAWINIIELPKSEFENDPISKIVQWDMSELNDGPYEIRAITQCFDVSLNPGISKVVQGRKETQPPQIFGTPQPADGVLNRGDEISITFTKRVNCDKIFQADGIGSNININNLALLDMTNGGILIDAIIACREDKIIITPNIPLRFLENHTLRAVVANIEDLYGNATDTIQWEFIVNNAALYWDGDDIIEVIQEGNELVVTRMIRNQGGQITNFNLSGIPEWMQVFPRQGSVEPGRTQLVEFRFPGSLSGGFYFNTIVMETIDGDKPLDIDLRVVCEPPDWNVNPANFSFSMNLSLKLNIEGELSTDQLDQVGAFVDGELRGVGRVQYNAAMDKHLVFLTVYSDTSSGEEISFRIWDAEACLLYGPIIETYEFLADETIGNPQNPITIHTQNLLIRQVYFNPGWNWFSYNLELPNPILDSALASISNPVNALIKSQTAFSTYSTITDSWIGNLNELSHLSMYQYRSDVRDSLLVVGMGVDPTTPINIALGWNWVGFLPQRSLPLNAALASLDPLNGDVIKSQTNFAQYVATIGWIGNLDFMSPLNGYLLRISNAGTLIFPDILDLQQPVQTRDEANTGLAVDLENWESRILEEEMPFSHWEVDPADFELSMNAIAIVIGEGAFNLLREGDEVAAFYNGEVRGSSRAVYVEALDKYMLFMTIYANREGELMQFRYYNSEIDQEYLLYETVPFQVNKLLGEVELPFEFTFGTTSVENKWSENHLSFTVHPNPARDMVFLNFNLNQSENISVSIRDIRGMEVEQIVHAGNVGQNTVKWQAQMDLPQGLYFISLKTADGIITRKLTLSK